MAVEIYIARHGQNEDNANGILNGHRDLPLTELGRQQAHDLAQKIIETGIHFDAVYSSPLVRASETASIVATELGLSEPQIIPELIERDFGIMTGIPVAEITERCAPDIIQAETITYFIAPEGAEIFPDLMTRGEKVLQIVRQSQHSGNALLVCHGDIGKMIYAAATGKDWRAVLTDFHFGNGDLIEVSPDNDAHKIKLPQFNH